MDGWMEKELLDTVFIGKARLTVYASSFCRWASNEPSSFDENSKEDCVAIHADPDWGKWSDENCVMETPFVCKTKREYNFQPLKTTNLVNLRFTF